MADNDQVYEVAVLGAGVVGSATAYYLTSRGIAPVLLLEQVRNAIVCLWLGEVIVDSELELIVLVFPSSLMLTILEVALMVDQELLVRHIQSPTMFK